MQAEPRLAGDESGSLKRIHHEILRVLAQRASSYARPVTSSEIGRELNVAPSYVREQVLTLKGRRLVRVRRGPGGGYYIDRDRKGRGGP
ncbi:Rrf2 family transcriptional regulator [Limnochorda pilosa]|uniref:AsnC family transcriptional regulator n=1 Tax=Limnochorda pilosa TaxID=1555112 RepID=A0A0K2SP72_LIMPI|nr:Rrf2 family transcriptional regulator [Limnochorda pilosa]BAS28792.1 AsnC family transcriptional regulator [Limnochorda pilosa]